MILGEGLKVEIPGRRDGRGKILDKSVVPPGPGKPRRVYRQNGQLMPANAPIDPSIHPTPGMQLQTVGDGCGSGEDIVWNWSTGPPSLQGPTDPGFLCNDVA